MNIAAFIISLFSAMISFFQGGCGTMLAGGGHGLAQRFGDTRRAGELAALGGSGLFVMLAAVVGVVGGSLSLAKKKASYICLGVSTGLCGLAFLGGFTDAVIWGILYGVAAFCAYMGNNGDAATSDGALSQSSNSTVQSLTIAQNSSTKEVAPRAQKVYEPVLGIETDALITRANLFLEDGNFDEAARYFEQALNQAPTNADAYLGKMLAVRRLHNAGELAGDKAPFEDDALFLKALRFAGEEMRARLEGYVQARIETMKYAKQEKQYQQALELKEKASSADDFRELVSRLNKLKGYKDSETLAKEAKETLYQEVLILKETASSEKDFHVLTRCLDELKDYKDSETFAEEISEKHVEIQYQEALSLKEKASSAYDFWSLAFRFDRLKGYKDSEALAKEAHECERRLNEEAAKAEKKAKNTGNLILLLIIIAFGMLLLWAFYDIFEHHKAKQADGAEKFHQTAQEFQETNKGR